MGTSSSSRGPGSNVPLIPPWVPPLPPPLAPPAPDADEQGEAANPAPPPSPPPLLTPGLAAPRRFSSARTSLGKFAKSASQDDLKRGLGHYTGGLGGSASATRRVARTAVNAGAMFGVLNALSAGTAPTVDLGVDIASLSGRPARDVASVIINALQVSDGTQDAEASRDAMSRAFSDLLIEEPDADLLKLAAEQIEFVTQRYIAEDLCRRIELDVGKAVHDKADDAVDGIRRMEEIREFVRQAIAASFRTRSERGQITTVANAARLAAGVLKDVFEIFEGYVR
ncbi:MAG: Qat anti-phage system associated protein QatB [Hyphomicrobium sp.]